MDFCEIFSDCFWGGNVGVNHGTFRFKIWWKVYSIWLTTEWVAMFFPILVLLLWLQPPAHSAMMEVPGNKVIYQLLHNYSLLECSPYFPHHQSLWLPLFQKRYTVNYSLSPRNFPKGSCYISMHTLIGVIIQTILIFRNDTSSTALPGWAILQEMIFRIALAAGPKFSSIHPVYCSRR